MIAAIFDVLLLLLVYPAALLLKGIRWIGVARLPLCKRALMQVGVFPIRNHYYEPLFDARHLDKPLDQDRELPGIDWNVEGQLALLQAFHFGEELREVPSAKIDDVTFHFNNGAFESGDAEFLYSIIRLKKPARLIEIGSGHSTRMAMKAILKNREEDPAYRCEHLCIEPYEMPWLEKTGVKVVRQKVEAVDKALFAGLERGDILFIDSSHVIRPQGDVLFEYLELLPTLKPGVIVHIHDIFSPKDYPKVWVADNVWLWNEQYLVEAFLTQNPNWKIIGALNYLHHAHFEALRAKCPFLTPGREPGSFYLERVD